MKSLLQTVHLAVHCSMYVARLHDQVKRSHYTCRKGTFIYVDSSVPALPPVPVVVFESRLCDVKMSSQQMLVLLTATVFTTFFGCMILDSSWQRHSSVIFGRPLSMSQLKSLATKAPRSYFRNYINSLSDSELNELIQGHFGEVSGLKSAALQRDFMACPGVEMLKHFSDAEGVVQIPKQQQACKNDMSFQSSGAPVALVSWPGSGNSWVRQLLETSTGIYTGSVDCDLAYIGAGMIGEGIVSNNVIAVKSHFDPPMWKFPNKIIYIVRNPFDAFVADWNREKSGSGTPHISEASYKYFGKC